MMSGKTNSNWVYSSEHGNMCPVCQRPKKACQCPSRPPGYKDGIIRIGRETKGRKGSGVSVVQGLPLAKPEMQQLARELKNLCGTGGTVKNNQIEIQGDHRDRLVAHLQSKGYRVKKSGG